ncbi:MAG: hypothetical protein ACK5DE_02720 [Bacteroidota bacterium]|jgi:hypothetical protein
MNYNIKIVHYLPNVDRKEYLDDKLSSFSNVTWFEKFQSEAELYPVKFKITNKEMLVWQAHHYLLTQECEAAGDSDSRFIILEDDTIIPENFDLDAFFNNALDEFHKSDADLLFLGKIPGLEVYTPVAGKLVYQDVPQQSVCTHAYSVKTSKIRGLLDKFETNLPIDHEFNRLIAVHGLKVAWTFPALEQGTIINKYKSNLR